MNRYIFLNQDGTRDFGLLVVVIAKTGVTYAHQCAGGLCETREVEGFAVPVGGPESATGLVGFFRRFRGRPPGTIRGGEWPEADLKTLQSLIIEIPFWLTYRDSDNVTDERHVLALSMERIAEATEAWLPVKSPYGDGILMFANSD